MGISVFLPTWTDFTLSIEIRLSLSTPKKSLIPGLTSPSNDIICSRSAFVCSARLG